MLFLPMSYFVYERNIPTLQTHYIMFPCKVRAVMVVCSGMFLTIREDNRHVWSAH